MKFVQNDGEWIQVDEPVWKDWIKPPSEHIADAAAHTFGDIMAQIGLTVMDVMPDTLTIMAMIMCLGAIAGIGKCGKWAAGSISAAVVFEVLNQGVGI